MRFGALFERRIDEVVADECERGHASRDPAEEDGEKPDGERRQRGAEGQSFARRDSSAGKRTRGGAPHERIGFPLAVGVQRQNAARQHGGGQRRENEARPIRSGGRGQVERRRGNDDQK